ncbi:MAG: DinB family protein, partial [Ginsengibacter sp.]
LKEHVEFPGKTFGEDFEELSRALLSLSRQWNEWIAESNEAQLSHVFNYYNSRKEFFKTPVYEMLLHLFNHQTYHRGQIVTMLRQNEVTKIPATDFIAFSRSKPGNLLKGRH